MVPGQTYSKVAMLCVCSVVVTGFLYINKPYRPQQANAARHAFFIEYIESSTDVTTGKSVQKQMFWAERADGSVCDGANGSIDGGRRVRIGPKKLEVRISDTLKQKSTFNYGTMISGTLVRRPPPTNCTPPPKTGYHLLGEEVVRGFQAHHYQYPPKVLPGGKTDDVHEWAAPELNCFEVKTVTYTRNKAGVLTNIFERKTTNVVQGEPDSSLFEVPEEYQEVLPSELERGLLLNLVRQREGYEAAKKYVIPLAALAQWARGDEMYLKLR